ncbi:Ubiquilin-4 [Hondaea fermentalgiana]|uniref:Ubiquilin-4 n=1 Tax=Hondaea fermentalgiana TaxID=2315210 RepID=A0A2R5GQ35_9STRA|nr:Ubiquilin-4 [Hondaea fermentalgiana]|eukprot:GBG30461.1 Ubiquilin-4 [Hondaea fermentalgiana]
MGRKIRVSVRCSTGPKFDAEADEGKSVLELKRALAEQAGVPEEQQRLIYKGRVLKDDLMVEHYNIVDGDAIHLVASSGAPAANASGNAGAAASGASAEARSAAAGIPTPGMAASAGPAGMPPGLGAMMDNPIFQSMLDNPEFMRSMMMANPQIRAMIEQNPQLGQVLSDPELLRTTMNAARNPALMNELMRNQDRAIANIESLPGGYNALARMYEDVAPMMDGPMNSSSSASGNTQSAEAGAENGGEGSAGAPIPNPWGGGGSGGSNSGSNSAAPGQNPAAGMMQNLFGGAGGAGGAGFPFGGASSGQGDQQTPPRGMPFSLPPVPPEFIQQMMQTMSGATRGQHSNSQPQQQNINNNNNVNPSANTGATSAAAAAAVAKNSARVASLRKGPNPWAPADSPDSPQVKYKEQLAQMEEMGFPDMAANIQALLRCDGDAEQAIEHLLEDMAK